MNQKQEKRNHKWLVLGVAGLVSGIAMLLVFRSVPIASGSVAATIITMIALKHLALFIAVSSPITAVFQTLKPKLRAVCGRTDED